MLHLYASSPPTNDRVKTSNQSNNVLIARELSKAYFLSLLMMMILHTTYIVMNFDIDICCVLLLDLCLPWASYKRKSQPFCQYKFSSNK